MSLLMDELNIVWTAELLSHFESLKESRLKYVLLNNDLKPNCFEAVSIARLSLKIVQLVRIGC